MPNATSKVDIQEVVNREFDKTEYTRRFKFQNKHYDYWFEKCRVLLEENKLKEDKIKNQYFDKFALSVYRIKIIRVDLIKSLELENAIKEIKFRLNNPELFNETQLRKS